MARVVPADGPIFFFLFIASIYSNSNNSVNMRLRKILNLSITESFRRHRKRTRNGGYTVTVACNENYATIYENFHFHLEKKRK